MLLALLRRSRFRRRTLATLLLGFFLPVNVLFAKDDKRAETAAVVPHRPTYFNLRGGTSLEVALDVAAAHSAEVFIQSSAPGATFFVLTPKGEHLEEIHVGQAGWVTLTFRYPSADRYRLIVQLNQNIENGISFRVDYIPLSLVSEAREAKAADLFAAAQSLAGSGKAISTRAAIEKYKQAAANWAELGNHDGQLVSLAGEARAWLNLSQYGNALAAVDRARLLSLHSPFFRAWLANLESEIYLDRWDSVLAMRFAQNAARLAGDLDDPWLSAEVTASLGEAEYLTDDPAARVDIIKAVELSETSSASEALARALRCESWMESDAGRVTHATGLMRQAEEGFRTVELVRESVDAMANLATIQGMGGDHFFALEDHSRLMPLVRDSGNRTDLAFLLVNIANDYMQLNRVPDAIAYYQDAVGLFRRIGLIAGESIGLGQLCMAETSAGRLRNALRDCSQSETIAEQLHDPKRIAVTIQRLGKVHRSLGNVSQAIARFRQAYDISAKVHDTRSQAQSLIDWGDALEVGGDRAQARDKFDQALPLSREAEDVPEQIEALYRLARSDFQAGQDEDAKSDLTQALKDIDTQRRAVGNRDLQASYFAQLHKCHQLYVELLMREHQSDPSAGAAAKALEISESGRALTLLDTLFARQAVTLQNPPAPPQRLLEMRIAVERAYDQRLRLMLEGAHKRDLNANETVLTQAIDTLERAEDERRNVHAGNISGGTPLSSDEIEKASRSLRTTLVEYALGTEHSYVWVVENGKIESHVLPPREAIESAVRKFRELATARIGQPGISYQDLRAQVAAADADLPRVAARLSCTLLGPFLKPQMDRLTIVPDGELALLPFAALPENGCNDGAQPLVVTRQIVLAPSISVLLFPRELAERSSWRGEVALVADPVFDGDDARVHRSANSRRSENSERFGPVLARLYASREEATAVAALADPHGSALYLDFDASLQNLLDPSLGEYRILHLATHGILDEAAPSLSGIVLSLVNREGSPVFGYLKIHDVERLNLHSDLVVLSSCDSGAGPNISGEGVAGLDHAFLIAGAVRVLSTLWTVDDESSKELMIGFYEAMLRSGMDPTEALRQSQIKLMRNPATSAPYYWAGFTLTTTTIRESSKAAPESEGTLTAD